MSTSILLSVALNADQDTLTVTTKCSSSGNQYITKSNVDSDNPSHNNVVRKLNTLALHYARILGIENQTSANLLRKATFKSDEAGRIVRVKVAGVGVISLKTEDPKDSSNTIQYNLEFDWKSKEWVESRHDDGQALLDLAGEIHQDINCTTW